MPDCPICRKPSVERYRPFCSKRCADIDLGKWLNEDYTLPDNPQDEDSPARAPGPGDKPH